MLWKKVAPKLSAGRVQSVATRIIVQRERDRMAFRSASYWDIVAQLDASVSDPQAQPPTFTARLTNLDGLRVATGRDFDSLGQLRKADEVVILTRPARPGWRRDCRARSCRWRRWRRSPTPGARMRRS